MAALGGLDTVVFTGGIGSNSKLVRREALEDMHWAGIWLDKEANEKGAEVISSAASPVRVYALQTDEEAMIAQHTIRRANVGKAAEMA